MAFTPLLAPNEACGAWSLSTYDRCEFRCHYCNTGVQGASTPRVPFEALQPQLRNEVSHLPERARISVGGVCDAYPDVELQYGVTRLAIETLIEEQRTFGIITKGTAVTRDADLLARWPEAIVRISLCSLDTDALRRVEPRTPTPTQRLEVLRELHEAGIRVAVSALPWIPGVSDAQAIVGAVGPDFPILFGPLDIGSPAVMDTRFGRRFDQAEINAAYLEEVRRVGKRRNVSWLKPPPPDDKGLPRPYGRLPVTAVEQVPSVHLQTSRGLDLPARRLSVARHT